MKNTDEKKVNSQNVLFHISETFEELTKILQEISYSNPDYISIGVRLKHAVSHLNTLSNTYTLSEQEILKIPKDKYKIFSNKFKPLD